MEKRALLAFILSLIVLFGYQHLFLSKVPQQSNTPEQQENGRIKTEPLQEESQQAVPEKTMDTSLPWSGSADIDFETIPEKWVIVDTDFARYRISTHDATIKDVMLKDYLDDVGKPKRMIPEENKYFPLQMMFKGKNFQLNFFPSQDKLVLDAGRDNGTIKMVYKGPDGSQIEKVFEFNRKSYEVGGGKIYQNRLSEFQLVVGSVFQKTGEKEKKQFRTHLGPVLDFQGEIKRVKSKEVEKQSKFQGAIPWIAVEDKYFMTALIPEQPEGEALAERLIDQQGSHIVFALTGKEETQSYTFYAGPKDYELLKSFGKGLEKVIDFGWFGFLARPMFYILKAIYGVVKSYGVAIIFLTTLIKIIFWPLTHKQQKSMKDMQKIQPEMNAIREKYKNDQQRMSREMMGLYKKHKVNPAAGCLPLVIQIPVFFALYNVLLNAIELRGAPFLYIQDLSAADTLFGQVGGFSVGPLPLLMGLSMYFQQKIMPSAMDPKQAKIMQMLPLVFTFMFLNFPSGLVLYWLVNNLLTIVQQLYINSRKKDEAA